MKRFNLSGSQRDQFNQLLNRVTQYPLPDCVKFIKFEYVFKGVFEVTGLYEHIAKYKTLSGKSIDEA
ncbi:hypothetical protein CHS0354_018913, partial [Potamilus streckersoni]